MIDLRKQPPFTTFQSRYKIGDTVWHARGVYNIPIDFKVYSIRFGFDPYGKLLAYYCSISDPHRWIDENDVFPNEQECYNSL